MNDDGKVCPDCTRSWQDCTCLDDHFADDEADEVEEWLSECAFIPRQGCLKAGSEECDFDCPFRDAHYRDMARLRDAKGRYAKRES